MWRFEAGLLCCFCVATILVPPCTLAGIQSSTYGKQCNTSIVEFVCGPNQRCKQETENITKCTCKQGYEYVNHECTKTTVETTTLPSPRADSESSSSKDGGGNSVAAILLVPTCLVIIGALAYFGARRYKWVQRFRQFRQNRYGSVLVTRDDTDDDDPPLA